jgi:hypothetical protein
MQPASADTVRGDFGGVRFAEPGGTFTFSRDGNRFGVRAEGPDGRVRDYDIKYTFGVTPLQQYLVELDGGRLQALTIAWDTRPREAGGQRWFSLYPGERLRPGDPLHWTGYEQTWNYQCAECHSTGVRKNYDATFGRYATGWAEVNVACEACHGPGSRHVAWAERRASWWTGEGDPRKGLMVVLHDRGQWRLDPATGNARRSAPRAADGEIEVCAVCHSRRSVIAEGAPSRRRLMETHLPALLDPELYHADGQQQGEVYTYASFLQSRMYREGVTCSDCHEPHSLGLRAPGNGVCAQCHAPARYDTASHHFHRPGSTGAAWGAATCRRRPTCWSIPAATTACACRAPTCPWSWACRTRARPVIPTAIRPGPETRCAHGTVAILAAISATRGPSTPAAPASRGRWPCSPSSSATLASLPSLAPRR